jgi:3-deoxy-D-manno-octulosonic-acid transferase
MLSSLRLGAVLLIYNLLLPVVMLLSLPGYIVKMFKRGGYSGHLRQRFAIYPTEIDMRLAQKKGPVWVHAVSVGEVLIAAKMIAELLRQHPEQSVVLSTTTSTGYAVAKERFGDEVTIIYNPLDFPWVVYSAFRRIDPVQLILVEAEVWPNLVCAAKWMGVPVTLINARLSDRSERRMVRFGFFIRPIYAKLERVFVQCESDGVRMRRIGVRPEAIVNVGSIKFDPRGVEAAPLVGTLEGELKRLFGLGGNRPVFLAGSTHAGEEELLGRACLKAMKVVPKFFYIVVPRHFERTDRIVARMRAIGMKPLLRTDMDSAADGCCDYFSGEYDSLIVNTTGELASWYFTADVAVIGKSFLSKGGQNPVEAILAGVPVFSGPDMSNFTVLVDALVEAGGMKCMPDVKSLAKAVIAVMTDDARREAMTRAAREVLDGHAGATERTVGRLVIG